MDPIISVFQKVLQKAREIQVCDIHLSVGSPWKYRQHGHVIGIKSLPPLKVAEADVIVRRIISQSHTVPEEEVEKAAKELQDFDCSYSLPGICRFRVNVCRQRGSFAIVLRVVPYEIPTAESLGLPKVINDIAMEERGLILVTGARGSCLDQSLVPLGVDITLTPHGYQKLTRSRLAGHIEQIMA